MESEAIKLGENGHSEYNWSNNTKDKLTQLFFQLVRTSNTDTIDKIKWIYRDLITECFFTNISSDMTQEKTQDKTQDKTTNKYVLLTIPLHTRDIISGKGEYHLFYVLIGVLCKTIDHYTSTHPVICDNLTNIVKLMIRKTLVSENNIHQYGSWKDVKYLLNYLKEEYDTEDKIINHPIFDYIMTLICEQVKADKNKTKNTTKNTDNISLIAKWLPREKSKKFGWQAKYIANDLFSEFNSKTEDEAEYLLSTRKCLTHYRKLLAMLNEKLKTPQINQCNKTWGSINFDKNVTSITMQKQKYAFQNIKPDNQLRSLTLDRTECRNNYLEYIKRCQTKSTAIKSARVEIIDMVREALRITAYNPNPDENIVSSINMQWEESGKSIAPLDDFVAMVDTSGSMTEDNGNPLHAAIGLGLRIAEKSKLGKRLMTFSAQPKWIDLEDEISFIKMAHKVATDSSWQMNTNFEAAVGLMLQSYISNNLHPDEVKNMVLVIFSDMQIDNADSRARSMNDLIKKMFADAGKYTSHQIPYEPCHILYWNLRSTSGFPCLTTQENISMLSGFSPQLLNTFCKDGIEGLKNYTPWNCLLNQLQNERYIWVNDCIKD